MEEYGADKFVQLARKDRILFRQKVKKGKISKDRVKSAKADVMSRWYALALCQILPDLAGCLFKTRINKDVSLDTLLYNNSKQNPASTNYNYITTHFGKFQQHLRPYINLYIEGKVDNNKPKVPYYIAASEFNRGLIRHMIHSPNLSKTEIRETMVNARDVYKNQSAKAQEKWQKIREL